MPFRKTNFDVDSITKINCIVHPKVIVYYYLLVPKSKLGLGDLLYN